MNKKSISGTVWECVCGHIEYGEFPPEDCPKCLRVGTFSMLPEELISEKEAENIFRYTEEDED